MLSSFVRKILLLSTIVSTFVSIFFPLQFSDDIYNLSHQRDSIKFCVKDSATKIFLKQVKVLLMSAVFSPVRNHHNRKIFLSLSSKNQEQTDEYTNAADKTKSIQSAAVFPDSLDPFYVHVQESFTNVHISWRGLDQRNAKRQG